MTSSTRGKTMASSSSSSSSSSSGMVCLAAVLAFNSVSSGFQQQGPMAAFGRRPQRVLQAQRSSSSSAAAADGQVAAAKAAAVDYLPAASKAAAAALGRRPRAVPQRPRRGLALRSSVVDGEATFAIEGDAAKAAAVDYLPAAAAGAPASIAVDSAAVATLTTAPSPAAAAAAAADPATTKKKKKKGKDPNLVIEGDTLETLPMHVALVAGLWMLSATALTPVLAYAASGAAVWAKLKLVAALVGSVVFSDFFSGVFHWSTDNYGNAKTPVFGSVIEAFQGHHGTPWTITHRSFFNNVHKIAKSALPMLAVCMALTGGLTGLGPALGLGLSAAAPPTMLSNADCVARVFWVVFFNAQMLSQEFHKLSHTVEPPRWAAFLQKRGLILSRKEHGLHHSSPFEGHYCILTGVCNPLLDRTHFWRRLEAFIYRRNSVEPNCWKEDAQYPKLKEFSLGLVKGSSQRVEPGEAIM